MWYSPDFPCSTLDKNGHFFSISGKGNRTEGDWDIKTPGCDWLRTGICRVDPVVCLDPDSDGIPIYKLPSILKHYRWHGTFPVAPQEPSWWKSDRGAIPSLSAHVRSLSLSVLWSRRHERKAWHDRRSAGNPENSLRLNLRAARSQVHGVDEVDVWLSKNQRWASKFNTEYTSQFQVISSLTMFTCTTLSGL